MGIQDKITGILDKAGPILDKAAGKVSPTWGLQRARARMSLDALGYYQENGYVTPGSSRKSMKGVTSTANSPDQDTIEKLDGMRALSRDLSMNSPLAASILSRHQVLSIGSGLIVQSAIDRDFLGLSTEEAEKYEREFEREFDLWAESTCSDFDGVLSFGNAQALGYLNMLVSGDFFWMPVWRRAPEKDFPYELCVKLIDADLVRDPVGAELNNDIQGGVEKKNGKVVAYHVWDGYQYEWSSGKQPKSKRVPVYDLTGRRQIFHVFDPKRINQRRGVPLLAAVADPLKQLTRLSEAQLMNALVSSFFTVFVRDMSGMGATLQQGLTPVESVTGGGGFGPDGGAPQERNEEDAFDLEMGHGTIHLLDDKKDISIADPGKTDQHFDKFWDALAIQVCGGANIPIEQASMHYTTSYTAARAAANDVWKHRLKDRSIINKRLNKPVYMEWFQEALLKGRVSAPRFLDDYSYRRAWTGTRWIGPGQGHIDPLKERKASVVAINNQLSTHEAEAQTADSERWDRTVDRMGREKRRIEEAGLIDAPDQNELIGPDGQDDKARDPNEPSEPSEPSAPNQ